MTHQGAAWKVLFEEAALRRDARAFALIVESVPELARACIHGAADYRYALPYFDDVVFRQHIRNPDRVQYMRLVRLHRDKGPADQLRNGIEAWYRHGTLHNEHEPAIKTPNGYLWFLHGKRHRDDGPAEFFKHGLYENEEWFRHGKRHRVGGPAVKDNNEEKWYVDDVLHRDDGPAVIFYYPNNKVRLEWFFHGVRDRVDGPMHTSHRNIVFPAWYKHSSFYRQYMEMLLSAFGVRPKGAFIHG